MAAEGKDISRKVKKDRNKKIEIKIKIEIKMEIKIRDRIRKEAICREDYIYALRPSGI